MSSTEDTLREKCPSTVLFLVRIQENTEQKQFRVWILFTQWWVYYEKGCIFGKK